jgi:hypothetical protein
LALGQWLAREPGAAAYEQIFIHERRVRLIGTIHHLEWRRLP